MSDSVVGGTSPYRRLIFLPPTPPAAGVTPSLDTAAALPLRLPVVGGRSSL